MSDRKYRQRGYQDADRERQPTPKPAAPPNPRDRIGPRTFNMPGYREVVRCARCGNSIADEITDESRCTRCGADLRACVQCTHFDTGQTYECDQPIPARISPKDVRNTCTLFELQRRVERETGSTAAGPPSARQAFDDLFK
jgi:hypothetical protein